LVDAMFAGPMTIRLNVVGKRSIPYRREHYWEHAPVLATSDLMNGTRMRMVAASFGQPIKMFKRAKDRRCDAGL